MRWFACLLLMGAIGAVSAGTVLEDDFEARSAATNIPDGWKIYRTVRGGKSGVILSGSVAGRRVITSRIRRCPSDAVKTVSLRGER